ncbi:DUF7847 domain-containing protein [Halococcoides cellulosivorans]|uniref:DUF7847 domain-containing protein n=1 Tax=Halococcoides cellulosivorans TaxID=1679096 RepID=A0A2R4WZP2_9EURY|nr:hypothetical protein [Halococcoides cellulosivorans]AWB26997.1 hypothetical protein HARCEL1_04370 [Halococcoides cellulosivorans]
MRPIGAYRRGLGALWRNPMLAGVIVLSGLLTVVSGVVSIAAVAVLGRGLLRDLMATIFIVVPPMIVPAVVAGLLTMSWRALDGPVTLDDFRAGVTGSNWVLLMLSGIIAMLAELLAVVGLYFLMFVAIVPVAIVSAVGIPAVSVLQARDATGALLVVVALMVVVLAIVVAIAIVILLVGVLPVLIMQFVPGAVVFEDHSPPEHGEFDAGKRGVDLLEENLLATIGFDLVTLALGVAITASGIAALVVTFDVEIAVSTAMLTDLSRSTVAPIASIGVREIGAGVVVSALISSLFGVIFIPAYAAFYEVIAAEPADPEAAVPADPDQTDPDDQYGFGTGEF